MSADMASGGEARPGDAKAPEAQRLAAVIDIGATAIRMEIAEIGGDGTIRTLDALRRGVHLGADTFTRGHIQQTTIRECADVLTGFRRVLDEYGIRSPEQIRAVATSSVREADNRDTFLDRIYIATGINVRAIDEAEENRLTYLAAQTVIENQPELRDGDVLVADVGGGSTEILLVQKGYVSFSNSYRLGSVRMRETLETHRTPTERVRTILRQHIQRTVDQISQGVPVSTLAGLVAMSGDSRFAAAQICEDWASAPQARIDAKTFAAFTEKILPLTVEKVVSRYHISHQEAETVGPALLVYQVLARAFKAEQIIVPKASLRDGLLREMAFRTSWTRSFAAQVVHSALTLGDKYKTDRQHARQVADLAVRLFAELQPEHQMDQRFGLLLEVAALLHEVGGFISSRSHHKHSMYLILNSDIFGLTRDDMTLIALVARYHRRALPAPAHLEYQRLDRDNRIAVSKMAAILRVADALDRNHMQQVKDLGIERKKGELVITVPGVEDLTVERLALREKANLFNEVYGLSVVLKEERAPREGRTDG